MSIELVRVPSRLRIKGVRAAPVETVSKSIKVNEAMTLNSSKFEASNGHQVYSACTKRIRISDLRVGNTDVDSRYGDKTT